MRARTAHLAAAAIIAAFTAFLGVFALRSYFFQDEFFYLRLAKEEGLTWDNLSGDVFGGFVPLFKLAFHPILGVLDVNYTAVALILVALGAITGWQMWRILVLLAGANGETLAALCFVCFSAVWIPSAIWPADGLHTLPAIVLLLASVEGYLRYALGKAGSRAVAVSAVCLRPRARLLLQADHRPAAAAARTPSRARTPPRPARGREGRARRVARVGRLRRGGAAVRRLRRRRRLLARGAG